MGVEKMSGTILMLSEVSFTYSGTDRVIFSNVDLSATMESRICIVGENGAGKTTLLKMVMEMEGHEPTKGTRTSHRNLKFWLLHSALCGPAGHVHLSCRDHAERIPRIQG